jgi:hypothetical protein
MISSDRLVKVRLDAVISSKSRAQAIPASRDSIGRCSFSEPVSIVPKFRLFTFRLSPFRYPIRCRRWNPCRSSSFQLSSSRT